jgi:CHAT domain-containing protein
MQILSPDSHLYGGESVALAFLITEFYGNLSRNTDKAGALRQAMLETMKKYPNPRAWAGFTLFVVVEPI